MRHTFSLLCALALSLGATQALAARLLMPDDLPAASAASSAPSAVVATVNEPPSFGLHFGVAAAAGFVGAPLGFLLANALGNLNIYLIPTAIFGLLPMGLVAPAFTALAAWIFGNWKLTDADGKFSFWLGFAAATIVHIAATVIAGFVGVSLAGIPGLILFSVIDGAAMGAATVGTMRFFRKPPAATASAVLPSFIPSVSATTVMPLTTIPF
ncbi:MAG: hypothetical protein Q8S33_11505 [Myxococcales bacterium]|nr:hypothetical protein [Myxococcales bacterium]